MNSITVHFTRNSKHINCELISNDLYLVCHLQICELSDGRVSESPKQTHIKENDFDPIVTTAVSARYVHRVYYLITQKNHDESLHQLNRGKKSEDFTAAHTICHNRSERNLIFAQNKY